jgi:RNA polymerase sigma-70 factor (ECF subfamily)
LFQNIVAGQKASFDALFKKYYQPLCRFAVFFTGNSGDAEEAVQNTFITVWENCREMNISRSVKAYLYQMTRNNALMMLRKAATRMEYEQGFIELQEIELPSERTLSDDEILTLVKKGLSVLPEKCRNIFALSRFDGLTYEEIAEYLDISPKTVENQMGIAFQKLRDHLAPVWKRMLLLLGVIFGTSILGSVLVIIMVYGK